MTEKLKVVFAPGCFDHFDGTQEELDSLLAEINRLVESGEILEKSTPVDLDSMSDDEMSAIAKMMDNLDTDSRKLH